MQVYIYLQTHINKIYEDKYKNRGFTYDMVEHTSKTQVRTPAMGPLRKDFNLCHL